jgi:hypothetical protein
MISGRTSPIFAMKYVILLLFSILLFSCDCMQRASGVILDKVSRRPIAKVAISKYETETSDNPFSSRQYSDTTGEFNYRSVSGGLFHCPGLNLYFSKAGYKNVKMNLGCSSLNDTIFLEKVSLP